MEMSVWVVVVAIVPSQFTMDPTMISVRTAIPESVAVEGGIIFSTQCDAARKSMDNAIAAIVGANRQITPGVVYECSIDRDRPFMIVNQRSILDGLFPRK